MPMRARLEALIDEMLDGQIMLDEALEPAPFRLSATERKSAAFDTFIWSDGANPHAYARPARSPD